GDPTVSVPTPPAQAGSALLLGAAAPNPFRGTVSFALLLPGAGSVRVDVLDVSGRRVRTLMAEQATAGSRSLVWDGRDARGASLPAGVYLVRAQSGATVSSRRVVLLH
ncbi:MAG: FlgD immunoglobulin-like domain containing protein, partial [Candidatus Eisenbacteria bacterium]